MSKEKQIIEEMAYDICKSRKANWADGCRVCSHHERCIYQDVAYALYNAGYRKQSEWISVDERLPERCGYYLGCTYKGFIMITPFFPVFANDKPEFCYDIVYWMPLPAPPKGE